MVLFTYTFYRLQVVGREFVPQKTGALLVPNHVSFIDGLLILASLDRPVRFIVDKYYCEHRVFRHVARIMGAIPMSSSGSPREILRAFRESRQFLNEGELGLYFSGRTDHPHWQNTAFS